MFIIIIEAEWSIYASVNWTIIGSDEFVAFPVEKYYLNEWSIYCWLQP